MASDTLPEPPTQLKAIQSYMKIAADIQRVNPVVAYWVRLHSTSTALSIDKDSPESKVFLAAIIEWLEKFKYAHKDDETVTNQTVGQAHYENFVVALFNKADTLDREGQANKNTVRMFYMAAVLFEAMAVFGPLTEEVNKRAKYAKFKAAYIQKCLKSGITPKPGPVEGEDLDDPASEASQPNMNPVGISNPFGIPTVPDDLAIGGQPSSTTPSKPSEPFIMNPSSASPYSKPVLPPPVPPSTPNQPSPTVARHNSSANKSVLDSLSPGAGVPQSLAISSTKFHATNGAPLRPEDLLQSQRYCKFANSALQYDDIPTAVTNLEKALNLLTTGHE